MNDDYIYVKMKIPRKNWNLNFHLDGGPLMGWLKQQFSMLDDPAAEKVVSSVDEYMKDMKFKQHCLMIFSDDEVKIAQYLTEDEFLSKDDFILGDE